MLPVGIDECLPKRIVTICSASRCGSTLLKSVLARSPDVTVLAGEEEPYIKATGNGYGYTSDYDGFTTMQNPALFRRMVRTELEAVNPWAWRLCLQYKGATLCKLLENLPSLSLNEPWQWLRKIGVAGYYDGCKVSERLPFREMAFEMPPFVTPLTTPAKNPGSPKLLLLKSPYMAYRPGILEQIFPEAEFSYLLLTRNPAAAINGLIDGWLAPYGFHKHLTPSGWWKFDLYPGWQDEICPTVDNRCVKQWTESYKQLLARSWLDKAYWLKFEDFLNDPTQQINRIAKWLDIEPPSQMALPYTMSTVLPQAYRWKAREQRLLPLVNQPQVLNVANRLDYGSPDSWR